MFDYTIKADASQALDASKQVEASLERVLAANKNLGESFEKEARRAADAQGRMFASAMRNAADLDQRLSTFRGFEGLARAIEQERDMLERIRGPAQQFAENLRVLDSLQARGAISAREYTDQLRALNAEAGKRPAKPGAFEQVAGGALAGTGLPGMLAGGPAGLAQKAVEVGIDAVKEYGDAYLNLDNRLRKLTSDEDERASLMTRTKDIANASRSEWGATGELFVRLSSVTKDMNLGQERTLRLTETISKAFAMSGASASESAGAMLQLSQAFASGHLQGDEFRSLAEAMPDIMDRIAATMHVSRSELKQLGTDGKITSDVLIASFENAQKDIDTSFGKTAPTLSQSWTIFKNEMTEVVGKLVKDTDLLPKVAEAFKTLASAIGTVASTIGKVQGAWESFKKLTGAGTGDGDKKDERIGGASSPLPPMPGHGMSLFGPAGDAVDAIKNIRFDHTDEEARQAAGVFKAFRDATDGTKESVEQLTARLIENANATLNTIEVQGAANKKISETVAEIKSQMTPALAEQGERWAASIGLATTAADTLTTYLDRIVKVTDAIKNQWSPATEQEKKDFEDTTKHIVDGTSAWGDFVDKSDKADTPHKNMLRLVDVGKELVKGFEKLAEIGGDALGTFQVSAADSLVNSFGDMLTSLSAIHNLNQQDRDTTAEIVAEAEKWDAALAQVQGSAKLLVSDFGQMANAIPDLIKKGAEFIALKKGDPWAADPKRVAGLSLEQKLLNDILGPLREYKKDVAALDDLLHKHLITTQQYNSELDKMTRKLGEAGALMANFFQQMERESKGPRGRTGDVTGAMNDFLEDPMKFDPSARQAGALNLAKAEEEIEIAQHKAAAERQNDLKADEEEFSKVVTATQKWRVELEGLRKGRDVVSGIKDGLNSVYKEITDVSGQAKKTIEDAFHGLEDSLVRVAQTGKFSFDDFFKTVEADLIRLSLRILEMRALMAIFGGGGGVGPSLGVGALNAISGGGHATGGEYVVPGSGPADSARVMFDLTPGERVSFTPPGAASSGGSGTVRVNNYWDPRALVDIVPTAEGARAVNNAVAGRKPRYGPGAR